jgi:hypothetical protein
MTTTHGTYARFFSLFHRAQREGKLRYTDHHDLVKDQTGRSSLKELDADELKRLEVAIQELIDPVAASANTMRRKVIAILAARGATKNGKPDMPHIYQWVLKYGYLHKPFNHYTQAELPRLVTQAERIVASDLKALQSHG